MPACAEPGNPHVSVIPIDAREPGGGEHLLWQQHPVRPVTLGGQARWRQLEPDAPDPQVTTR